MLTIFSLLLCNRVQESVCMEIDITEQCGTNKSKVQNQVAWVRVWV